MQQFTEGQRRASRRTGEVQEFRGGAWVTVAPGQAPTAGPGVIEVAPPQARQPSPQTPAQATVDTFQAQAAPHQARAAEANADRAAIEAERARRQAADPAGDAGAEQRKAAGFYSRAIGANQLYEQQGVGPRSAIGEVAAGIAPTIVNQLDSSARQQAEASIRDFVASTLRYESGAAIPTEELETQRRIYFPMPGDSPETVRLKAQLRANAINALRLGSGEAAAAVDPAAQPAARDGFVADIVRDAAGDVPQWERDPETGEEVLRIGVGIDPGTGAPVIAPTPQSPSLGRSLHMFAGDVAEGVGDLFGLVSNPLQVASNSIFGTNFRADVGADFRDMTGAPDPGSNAEMLASAVNRGGTSALSLSGLATRVAPFATGAVQNALMRFGAAPLADTTAGAVGAGASEATRQAGGGPVAQILAGVAGGGLTLPISGRVNSLFDAAPPVTTPLTRAAEAENIAIPRAMVDDSRRTQQRVTAVDRTMAGGPIIQSRMDRVGRGIEGRVSDLGRGGTALDENNAGQAIRGASERYIRNSGREATRLYNAAETASEGIRVPPQQSLAVVDEVITRLSETGNTNATELTFLRGLREDLSNNLSVGALRDLRTTLRQRISDGALVFGQNEARVLDVMDAAGQDIEAGLRSQGRERAAGLFRRADDMYADRMDFIRNGVQRLIGTRNNQLSPERVFANFRAMASPRGDNANLARMVRAMEPEEQIDMAATFAEGLGRGPNGEFTVAQFVRQAKRLPEGARVNVFGRRGAESVENLLTIARDYQRVRGAMGGSPTGVSNDYRSFIGNAVLGLGSGLITQSGMTGAAIAVGGVAAKAGRDIINARLLMSPNIQSWLRTAPRSMDPRAIDDHFGRLREIAAREPALASQIEGLEQTILRAANENLERAAAASESDQQQRR